jgi:hypothetical protein
MKPYRQGAKKSGGFSPCAFPLEARADFAMAGAKVLIILAGCGTTEVVP